MKRILWMLILLLPAFGLMLKSGIYTMHDFHVFRQFEFDKCARELSLPCRWAPDSTLGYGQPLFNFYGQLPYWLGEVFHLSGLQVIDSVKLVFILTLVLSASAMYVLANDLWGRRGGMFSAIFYVYAPYRAVDVWVRGALNEAMAFVFFPIVLFAIKKYIESAHNKYVIWLALSLAALVLTHNLSLLMFVPFALIWTGYWLAKTRNFKSLIGLIEGGLLAILLSGFYLLPVLAENHLVTLGKTTQGYYDFKLHYVSLKQLFISNFWGYGGSTWGPNDTLSFASGYMHWVLTLVLVPIFWLFKRLRPYKFVVTLVAGLAVLAWFLTHGKSEFIWIHAPGIAFVQFPWRFLSMGVVFSSLAIGSLALIFKNKLLLSCFLALLLLLNVGFFRPDIWRNVTDREQFSGALWLEQISSAISDFWPVASSELPKKPSSGIPTALLGDTRIKVVSAGAHKFVYKIDVYSEYAKIRFPIVYFPGWQANNGFTIFPEGKLGLITTRVPMGQHLVELQFTDTPVRTLGNLTSLVSIGFLIWWGRKYVQK